MEYYKNLSLENISYVDPDGNLQIEEWKDIPSFEGLYMISSLGRVKSLKRTRIGKCQNIVPVPEIIRKQQMGSSGYLQVSIHKETRQINIVIHQMVAFLFITNPLNKKTVNHKKGIKTYNAWYEIEWNTQRENAEHYFLKQNKSSKYIGVCWIPKMKKWKSMIYFNKQKVFLGYFINEIDAANAYLAFKKQIQNEYK